MIQEGPELDQFKAEMRASVTIQDKAAEALKHLDQDKAEDCGWESNRDDQNPKNLPWPEENESKE